MDLGYCAVSGCGIVFRKDRGGDRATLCVRHENEARVAKLERSLNACASCGDDDGAKRCADQIAAILATERQWDTLAFTDANGKDPEVR